MRSILAALLVLLLVGTADAQINSLGRRTAVAEVNLDAGVLRSTPEFDVNIPDRVSQIIIQITSANWPSTVDPDGFITLLVEQSVDGGATWTQDGATVFHGARDKEGNLPAISVFVVGGQTVKMRASIISNKRLRLGLALDAR